METTKICRRCQEIKTLDSFYVHKEMADGHLNICKECTKKRVGKHRENNLERIQEYDRQRGRTEKRKSASVEGKKRIKALDREAFNKRQARYNAKREKIKNNARQKVDRAILKGVLIRPSVCEDCGQERYTQGHHEDYSKPLNVVWVCTACHGLRHRKD